VTAPLAWCEPVARRVSAAPSRGRGFTLLEVMVALALLAAALMAIADLCGNALRNHAYARDLSAATLLARGKMAELTQKYEDQGFKDIDEEEDGDFADDGRPDVKWHLVLIRPDPDLSPDQMVAMLAGVADSDPQELLAKLMGAAGAGGASAGGDLSGAAPGASAAGAEAALVSTMLQAQLRTLGETLKSTFREMRLTVSWQDGKASHGFTVTTHLLVLNPRAPGGARGDDPEVPPNLAAVSAGGR
jgi:general secretion pathway protein I